MSFSRFGVKKPVASLVLFFSLLLLGFSCFLSLPVDLMPKIEPPIISVITFWPGASPEDVETKVSKTIENDLSIINNLDSLASQTKEGLSIVTCTFGWKRDLNEACNDIRERLEYAKKHMPSDVQDPMIFKFNTSMAPVVMYSISAQENWEKLYDLIDEQIVTPVKRIAGVGAVQVFGGLRPQINVKLDKDLLSSHSISLDQIEFAFRKNHFSLPAGNINLGASQYLIRIPGEFEEVEQMKNMILSKKDHNIVRLKDIADVELGFKEIKRLVKVDKNQSLMMMVQKQSGENTVEIAKNVIEKVNNLQKDLPQDIKMSVIMDTSEFINRSVSNLSKTAFWGIIFVGVITFTFLRKIITSFIVVITIPIAVMMSFILMFAMGWSLNIITLAGLALAIGMVVDNAIVVLENIIRKTEDGEPADLASINGANEVGRAIFASTMTTIVVFFPLLFLSGFVGVMFKEMGGMITVTLVSSLLCALILTPLLSYHLVLKKKKMDVSNSKMSNKINSSFLYIESKYTNILKWALDNKKKTVGIAFSIFVVSLLLYAFIGTEFMPNEDTGNVAMTFELPVGTTIAKTSELCEQIEEIGLNIANKKNVEHSFWKCGETDEAMGVAFSGKEGSHIGQVSFKLVKQNKRNFSSKDLGIKISDKISSFPEIIKLTVDAGNPMNKMMGSQGKPLSVEIYGHNLDETQNLARKIQDIVHATKGAKDPIISRDIGKPEMLIKIDKEHAANLGLTVTDVAKHLRTLFYGREISKLRSQEQEYSIFMQLHEKDKNSLDQLLNINIFTNNNKPIRLDSIAHIEESRGPTTIDRKNQQRIVKVEFDTYKRSQGEVLTDIKKEVSKLSIPNNVSIAYGGMIKEQKKAFSQLLLMLFLGLILVYMVMAAEFESFLHPFVVMFSVPFALTGVFLMLTITKTPMSVMGFIGIIMLIGIVVNNAIVLIDYTNRLRSQNIEIKTAIVQAGTRRLRPILMTTLTTIFGMVPLVFSRGEGSEMWKPLGMAVIGGLLFSTLITLVLIPALYLIFNKKKKA